MTIMGKESIPVKFYLVETAPVDGQEAEISEEDEASEDEYAAEKKPSGKRKATSKKGKGKKKAKKGIAGPRPGETLVEPKNMSVELSSRKLRRIGAPEEEQEPPSDQLFRTHSYFLSICPDDHFFDSTHRNRSGYFVDIRLYNLTTFEEVTFEGYPVLKNSYYEDPLAEGGPIWHTTIEWQPLKGSVFKGFDAVFRASVFYRSDEQYQKILEFQSATFTILSKPPPTIFGYGAASSSSAEKKVPKKGKAKVKKEEVSEGEEESEPELEAEEEEEAGAKKSTKTAKKVAATAKVKAALRIQPKRATSLPIEAQSSASAEASAATSDKTAEAAAMAAAAAATALETPTGDLVIVPPVTRTPGPRGGRGRGRGRGGGRGRGRGGAVARQPVEAVKQEEPAEEEVDLEALVDAEQLQEEEELRYQRAAERLISSQLQGMESSSSSAASSQAESESELAPSAVPSLVSSAVSSPQPSPKFMEPTAAITSTRIIPLPPKMRSEYYQSTSSSAAVLSGFLPPQPVIGKSPFASIANRPPNLQLPPAPGVMIEREGEEREEQLQRQQEQYTASSESGQFIAPNSATGSGLPLSADKQLGMGMRFGMGHRFSIDSTSSTMSRETISLTGLGDDALSPRLSSLGMPSAGSQDNMLMETPPQTPPDISQHDLLNGKF